MVLPMNGVGMMWKNVESDVDDARNDLSLRRAATLQRHAEELDKEGDEIEQFARVAAAFAKRYKVQQDSATAETKEGGKNTNSLATETNSEKAEATTGTRTTPNFAGIMRRVS
jgi:hypothetical protein